MLRVLIALLLLLVPSVAQAEKRLALLIGNQSYSAEIGRLSNPHNDVALLEKVLKGLGFDVMTVRDAGLATLHQVVNGYARRMQAAGPNAVGFFYGDLWDQSLQLTEITRKLKRDAGNATNYVVFDACRTAMSGSGFRTAGKTTIKAPRRTAQPG